MINTDSVWNGYPIVITTWKSPVRHHKKRRIRKKWAKKQLIFEFQKDDEVVINNGKLYMNENTYLKLKGAIENESGKSNHTGSGN